MDQPDAAAVRAFLEVQRRAVLATVDGEGAARLVPIAFVLDHVAGDQVTLFTPIDEKPKHTADPYALARVRDLQARPWATVLVDRWSEDWSQLAWIRLGCRATILASGARSDAVDERATALRDLRAKYPQYATHDLESRPLIRLDCSVKRAWGVIEEEA